MNHCPSARVIEQKLHPTTVCTQSQHAPPPPNRVFTALKQVVDDKTMAASDMPTGTTQKDPDSTTKGVKAGRKRLQRNNNAHNCSLLTP